MGYDVEQIKYNLFQAERERLLSTPMFRKDPELMRCLTLSEVERLKRIDNIAREQLSHEVDLPGKWEKIKKTGEYRYRPGKLVKINGVRKWVKDKNFPVGLLKSLMDTNYVLPEEERTYVESRSWKIC